ncbi:MAG: hypothetical protein IKK24_02985 [Clostridia bacterium]|nr:hypothetical protein [Clostridia bacterium]
MKPEKLQDAIGLVGDDLIEEAEFHTQRKTKSKWWMALTAACLTLAIIAAAIFLPEKNIVKLPNDGGSGNKNQTVQNPVNLSAYALNEAVYPQTVAYPEYEDFSDEGYNKFEKEEKEWRRSRNELNKGYSDTMNIDLFFKETFKSFLSNSEGDNMIYSPLNIYFALGMLAELTDGNSRKQILDAVGTKSIEALRNDANALWRANYYDDGRTTSILASSLWLN